MKTPAMLLFCMLGSLPGLVLQAETPALVGEAAEEKELLTAEQLDELLAPIALYPDPLIAIILPAATFPADVVMAARYLKDGGDVEAVEDQPWDDSVKALARYPEVVKWMDENLAWTKQVGAAFLVQPAAVMTGTQRLRAAARDAGNLKDTPEQRVVVEREVIRIVPAQREVIYVPVYDPVWVYRPRVVNVHYEWRPITFSVGYRTGFWLSYYCNWGYNTVVVINRPNRVVYWQSHPGWIYHPGPSVVHYHHVWRPAPARVQVVRREFERRPPERISRPTPNSYVQRGQGRDAPARGIERGDGRGRDRGENRVVAEANPTGNREMGTRPARGGDGGVDRARPSRSPDTPRVTPAPNLGAPSVASPRDGARVPGRREGAPVASESAQERLERLRDERRSRAPGTVHATTPQGRTPSAPAVSRPAPAVPGIYGGERRTSASPRVSPAPGVAPANPSAGGSEFRPRARAGVSATAPEQTAAGGRVSNPGVRRDGAPHAGGRVERSRPATRAQADGSAVSVPRMRQPQPVAPAAGLAVEADGAGARTRN